MPDTANQGYQHAARIIDELKKRAHPHNKIARRLFSFEHPFSSGPDYDDAFEIERDPIG